jgi:hypothetical protein
MARMRAVVAAGLAMLLAGCMTAYQPHGVTGGYKDEKIDADTYRVSFFGNGNTHREAVLKYFLYRCAELTLQNGYQYFELFAAQKPVAEGPYQTVADVKEPPIIVAQTYTITTWSASGIVRMHKEVGMLGDSEWLFSAREVTGMLGSEVQSGNPDRNMPAKLRRVTGKFPVMPADPKRARAQSAPPAKPGAVGLDDLKDLLPK